MWAVEYEFGRGVFRGRRGKCAVTVFAARSASIPLSTESGCLTSQGVVNFSTVKFNLPLASRVRLRVRNE